MTRRIYPTTLSVVFVLLVALAAGLAAQETLTNADVVKMVQAHLSADVIVQQIESNPGHYLLTTNSLIRLKQAGVPDKVIAAMQARGGARDEEKRKEQPAAKEPDPARSAGTKLGGIFVSSICI